MGRLDWVTVATGRGNIVIPWASRDTLLRDIRRIDSGKSIRDAFEDVGASTPVKLSRDDKANLVELLDFWSTEVSVAKLPEGMWDLHNALVDDLHYTAQRQGEVAPVLLTRWGYAAATFAGASWVMFSYSIGLR